MSYEEYGGYGDAEGYGEATAESWTEGIMLFPSAQFSQNLRQLGSLFPWSRSWVFWFVAATR